MGEVLSIRKKVIKIITYLLLAVIINKSSPTLAALPPTRTVKDMAGRTVRIPTRVQKIAAIESGALRLAVYLGATEMVVGVEEIEKTSLTRPYILAHPQLAKLPSLGPFHGGDAELITASQPDVIFWTYTTKGKADALQQKTGIPVIALDYGDLDLYKDRFYKSLKLMGEIIHREQRATAIIDYLEKSIMDLQKRTQNNRFKKPVYIGGVSFKGAHGITSTEPRYPPFRFINAPNIASEIALEHAFIDKEQLIAWDPAVIFIDAGGAGLVTNDLKPGSVLAQNLRAVKTGQVYQVFPYNNYTTNYETVLVNTYYIGKLLYPEEFSDINPEAKAEEIYRFFLGQSVLEKMQKLYGGFQKVVIE